MPKTKESYIRSHGKAPSDLIKTPNRAKTIPKQNTHTVTRNVSTGAKKAVKSKESLLKGTNKAVKTGNSYVGKAAKKKTVKTAKRAAKTQREITKKQLNKPQNRQSKRLKRRHRLQRQPQKRLSKSQLKSLKW